MTRPEKRAALSCPWQRSGTRNELGLRWYGQSRHAAARVEQGIRGATAAEIRATRVTELDRAFVCTSLQLNHVGAYRCIVLPAEDEFEALPDNAKAEVLALARKMIRAKGRQSILDAAYNRYAFHDDNLPEWFEEDEEKHMRPLPPVTPEEIEAEKARLRAIDARPIKKVAEAKARKKKRAVAAMAKAQAKARGCWECRALCSKVLSICKTCPALCCSPRLSRWPIRRTCPWARACGRSLASTPRPSERGKG